MSSWTAADVYVPPKVGVVQRMGDTVARIANSIVEKCKHAPEPEPPPCDKVVVERDRSPRIVRVDRASKVNRYVEDSDTLMPTLYAWADESVAAIYYWYQYSAYEGTGYALIKYADGRWRTDDLNHCSCYEPAERWPCDCGVDNARPLGELLAAMDEELLVHIYPLLEAMANDA